jgi:hypothetical protein
MTKRVEKLFPYHFQKAKREQQTHDSATLRLWGLDYDTDKRDLGIVIFLVILLHLLDAFLTLLLFCATCGTTFLRFKPKTSSAPTAFSGLGDI